MVVRATPKSAGPSAAISWETASTELRRRHVLMEVYGDIGSGKTTLALTAPGPIALIHSAEKIDGIVQGFAGDKEIRMLDCGVAITSGDDDVERIHRDMFDRFKTAWIDALGWAKTIIIDTHTEAWQIIRLAYFGALKPESGRVDRNYDAVNAEFGSLINRSRLKTTAAVDGANVILIGHTADEWTKPKGGQGEKTGRTIRATYYKQVTTKADIILRTHNSYKMGEPPKFWSVVEKAWNNGAMLGSEFQGDMSTFPTIMGMITGTDPAEWGG